MRAPLLGMIVAAGLVGAAACAQIIDIGDPKLGNPGAGGSGGTGGAPDGGAAGEGPPPPCHPTDPVCNQVDSDCLALVDNSARDVFGLRMQQATIYKPDALSSGLEYSAISQALTMNLDECYLLGGGTINLLLELDTASGTGRVGSGYPVEDPNEGYVFVEGDFDLVDGGTLTVAPASVDVTIEEDGTVVSSGIDTLNLPLFLDLAATLYVLVPLHAGRLFETTISADRNCIGSHNAAGLSLDNGCLPDIPAGIKSWIDGGRIEGHILLEEADQIIVTAFGLNRSLCVILSQDPTEFAEMRDGYLRCQYLAGEIKFPGDWCSATDSGATPSCHDASKFAFAFAASGVAVH